MSTPLQRVYIKGYFPKRRPVALSAAIGLLLSLVYLLSSSNQASWATEIPEAARLIGNGGTMKTFTGTSGCTGGMRGMTSDGTYVYFRTTTSASNICIANISDGSFVRKQAVTGSSLASVLLENNALTYSSGCIFLRNSMYAASTVNCIDTSTWIMSAPITPTGGTIPTGGGWLMGNLMNFPDGRVGTVSAPTNTAGSGGAASGPNQCPVGNYCKILRTFTVTRNSGTAVLTFSEDFTLADPIQGWPSDDHGMATDGTYLYEIMHSNGYKVWGLNSGTPSLIVFNGAGSGTCTAPSGISGSMCYIYQPISPIASGFGANNTDNATFLGRSHGTNQYLIGSYNASKFWLSNAVAPPPGPGSASAPDAPTSVSAITTGSTTATVSFTAPAGNGGATITSYTATSSPSGVTATLSQAGSGSITVTGLASMTSYTFTVTATNTAGTSLPSVASNSITPGIFNATITVPETTLVTASATTSISGVSVGGLATGSSYLIAIAISGAPSGATLKLPTTTGLTASYGYSSGSNTFAAFTNISFTGLLANVNNAVGALQYLSGSATSSPTIQVTASSSDSNYALNGYNGHFYVSSTSLSLADATYTNARAAAKLRTYRGLSGYLTTITSSGENTFISGNIASAGNIWFGATDELSEGVWKWDTSGGSPEAGTQFWQGLAAGATVNGMYRSWASGEPNDSGGEDYPVTNWGGGTGTWNDCSNSGCGANRAYVIEFGTNAADGGFVNASSNLGSSSFTLFYSAAGQVPSVLLVDPQAASLELPTTIDVTGPAHMMLCLNETDSGGTNLGSPNINFDVATKGSATTAGTGSVSISGDRTKATYKFGAAADVISTLVSGIGTRLYLDSGTFGTTKYIKIRAISIKDSSNSGAKTCASAAFASQNIEIRPLALDRTFKKGVISLRP